MPIGLTIEKKLELHHVAQTGQRLRNNSGGALLPGVVVVIDTTVLGGDAFTTTTSQDSKDVAGVLGEQVPTGRYGFVVKEGYVTNLSVDGTVTPITAGDLLSTYTTAGVAGKASAGKAGGFAIALQSTALATTIKAIVFPAGRIDASASVTYGVAGEMAADGVGAANAAGAVGKAADIAHVHTNTADTPALTLGTTNVVGSKGSILAANASIAIFDTTVPTTIQPDTSAASGSAAFAANRGHYHGIVCAAPLDGSLAAANAKGSATTFSISDHAHKAILLNDVPLILGTTDAAATANRLEYDTAETADALKLGLGTASRRLIICDYADMGSDTALAQAADPQVVIMDNTFADYIRLFATTAGGFIDVPSGDTIALQVNALTEVTIDANGITLAADNYIQNNGAAAALRKMLTDVNGNELLETYGTADAVNHLTLTNSATGTNVIIGASGTGCDANAGITLLANGTGAIVLDNGTDPVQLKFMGAAGALAKNIITDLSGLEILELQPTAVAVNHLVIITAATGGNVTLTAVGTGCDANAGIAFYAGGTGAFSFDNATDPVILLLKGAQAGFNNEIQDVNGNEILALQGVATAVNEFTIGNAATGDSPILSVQGGDANIGIGLTTKGAGSLVVKVGANNEFAVTGTYVCLYTNILDGGSGASENLTLESTLHATKGHIIIPAGDGGLKVGGTASHVTVGTNTISLFNGTAPAGALVNGCSLYSAGGELYAIDAAGNASLQS